MVRKVGMWIDHAKAVLVSLDDQEVATRTVVSNVGKHVRAQGGAPSGTPYGAQDATYEARIDRKYEQHLRQYYDSIVSEVSGATAIFIMGPGAAKTELRKRLEASGVAGNRLTVEAADKLTDAQVVERVKTHYNYPTREAF